MPSLVLRSSCEGVRGSAAAMGAEEDLGLAMLPMAVLAEVLKLLTPREVAAASAVCRRWSEALSGNDLAHAVTMASFPRATVSALTSGPLCSLSAPEQFKQLCKKFVCTKCATAPSIAHKHCSGSFGLT